MSGKLPFTDARVLLERANAHRDEFTRSLSNPTPWGLQVVQDALSGEYVYYLKLDRAALRRSEPIAADVSNNLVHALDQIVAAWARAARAARPHIYYPTSLDANDFELALQRISKFIPAAGIEAIQATRSSKGHVVEHVALIKELSNEAKHWRLVATDFAAHAVGVAQPGHQDIVNIPDGHFRDQDTFEFARTRVPPHPMIGFQVLLGLSFSGLKSNLVCDPATAFRCAAEFVETAISNAEAAWLQS